MKIQLYSDLHLEYTTSYPKITKVCPYLFLAGDIGQIDDTNYRDFISYCSTNWETVIVVLGNHEMYHETKDYNSLLNEYKEFFSLYPNIHLLEHETFQLGEYIVLGCTMWAHMKPKYTKNINSLHKIKRIETDKNGNEYLVDLGRKALNKLHERSKQWLLSEYDENRKTIIITHHPITQENVRQKRWRHESEDSKSTFSTEFSLISNSNSICISGHTHYSHDFIRNNIRYISNQKGYKNEGDINTNYCNIGVYDLDEHISKSITLDERYQA